VLVGASVFVTLPVWGGLVPCIADSIFWRHQCGSVSSVGGSSRSGPLSQGFLLCLARAERLGHRVHRSTESRTTPMPLRSFVNTRSSADTSTATATFTPTALGAPSVRMRARIMGFLTAAGMAAVVVLGAAVPASAGAFIGDFEVDYIWYTVTSEDDATVAATDYDEVAATDYDEVAAIRVYIPSSVDNSSTTYTVTSIGDSAFQDNSLGYVNLPDSVTSIGVSAFDSNGLWGANIPDSVTSIGDSAFFGNSLTMVTIPNSVTSIGDGAFRLNNLRSLTISDSVTSIAAYAFASNWLESVLIPDSVTSIGEAAFAANWLESVLIPDSVTSIGEAAFAANWLESLTIPDSVTSIGEAAFASNSLSSLTIPDSVTSIGAYAFERNFLTSVTIPDSVTSIGAYAFERNFLTSVTIPDSVTSIGTYAFGFNPLASVVMQGNAPATGSEIFGSADGVTVYAPSAFAEEYASPWAGYVTFAGMSVVYDVNGHGVAPASFTTESPASAIEPADPSADGYVFEGWLHPAGGWSLWDFSTIITEDTTLYAHWIVVPSDTPTGDNPGTAAPADPAAPADLAAPAPQAAPVASAVPETVTVDGASYIVDATNPDAGVTLQSYTGATGVAVEIPATVMIDGVSYPVTAIGDGAYANNDLTSVTIPDSVTTIGPAAFAGNALTKVTIPASVTSIGAGAFDNTTQTDAAPASFDDTSVSGSSGIVLASVNSATTATFTTVSGSAAQSNTLTTVVMQGGAPTIGALAFGVPEGMTVYYPSVFAAEFGAVWGGYTTAAGATVSYAANGHGTAPETLTIVPGTTTSEPTQPSASGYVFAGWFDDATAGTLWDFSTPVTTDTVLYAQWTSTDVAIDSPAAGFDLTGYIIVFIVGAIVGVFGTLGTSALLARRRAMQS
jgi:uncharacterized repeat protein (TIGR02543 family)